MRFVTGLVGALLLLPLSANAQSTPETEVDETRQYTVEIILFRYADTVSAGTEVFVPDPPPEPEEPVDDFGAGIDPDAPVLEFGDARTDEPVELDAFGNPVVYDEDGNPVLTDAGGNRIIVDEDGNPLLDDEGNPLVEREPLPPRADYVLLIEDELTLGTTWDQLERLSAYEPFAHFGWTQRVSPFAEPIAITTDKLMPPEPGFNGDFTLYLSRFLHLKVQLEQNANPDDVALESDPFFTYSDDRSNNRSNDRRNDQPIEPLPYDSYSAAVGKTFYRIDEDRIFKSGDLRYFDHPRMGVLAKIERVVEPEPEEEPEAIVAPASSL